jgi:hypothetical protein
MTAVRRRLHPPPTEPVDTPEVPLVVKRRDEIDGDTVEREAEVLRALAGGPVVDLVDCRSTGGQVELLTLDAGSSTLADAAHLPPRTALRAAAATCRSVVALHRAGWGHGALDPDHVVVGGRGRATLCSLGRAQPLVAAPQLVTADRSATFATLLYVADQLDADQSDRNRRRAAQVVRRAVGAADQDLLDVAAAIESDLADRYERRRPSGRRWLAAAGVLGTAALLVGAWTWTGRDAGPAQGPGLRPAPGPDTAATLPPGRVRVGLPGDEHVVVDLDCDGDDELLLLRPTTGELFVAPRVPDGAHAVRTVPIGNLPGAASLTTRTTADGCATPIATLSDGSAVPVEIAAPAAPTTTAPPEPAPPSTTAGAPPVASTEPAATPSSTSVPTSSRATNRPPAATPPRVGTDRPRPVPASPSFPAPSTTDPPFEYPVGDGPLPAPDPTEEPA